MFSKKIKLTHHCFKSSSSIYSSWIDRVIFFFIFQSSKIHVSPTSIVSSLSSPWCRLSSVRCRHAATPYHASFPWSQDDLAASASSSSNTLSRCLPPQTETKALNPHQRRRPPSPNHPILILHCYKNVILTLTTILITQSHLYFTSSLARAPSHWSPTHHHRSISSLSHTHRPST
jgi:hypothetical protein